jgi:serine/threonine-protein kinase HipA
MSDALTVVLDGVVGGVLRRLSGGRLRFDYDPAYQERPAPTPLSLSMPAQVASHSDRVVAPWLWGLLPDNAAVLRRWARELGASANSAFSLLATPIGEDCAGAVRFVSPEDVDAATDRPGDIVWLDEEEVAQRLRELRQDSTAWLGESFTGQFSLAGAQAKTALIFEDGRWGVPSGATPTTHILKPGVSGFDDHDLNEHLCLDAARHAGLPAARTAISRFAGESAVVVTRYDRLPGAGGQILRVHQEDLCQALGVPPERKYQSDGGPTPAQIARLLRDAMAPSAAEESVRRFADALIWNWLIAGTDAHAKNYSLLLSGEQVRLAPLYDVASALPYATAERKLRLAMKTGKSYDVYSRGNPWISTADDLGIDGGALTERAAELAGIAPEAFAEAAGDPAVAALGSDLPKRLHDLVSARAGRCLDLLA